MLHILNSSLEEHEKVKQYYALLQKKMNMEEYNLPWKSPEESAPVNNNSEVEPMQTETKVESMLPREDDSYEHVVLNSIPRGMRNEASKALDFIKEHSNILKWHDKGEILIGNELISKTNIADLFNIIFTHKKKTNVAGMQEFLTAINLMNMPKHYVKNNYFDDFTTHTSNEAMNAVELSSEVLDPVLDEEPSTSSDYRDPATPTTRSQHFICPTCSKSFAWKKSLALHMKIHNSEKLFTCEICKKSFGRNHDLKRHMETHDNKTTAKKDDLKCNICVTTFGRNDSLKRHMKVHAIKIDNQTIAPNDHSKQDSEIQSTENELKCNVCDKAFGRNYHLKRHMKIHEEENDFKCPLCDQIFQRKHCFAMHMQKHQEIKYDCQKCDRSFLSLQNLNRHVRATHPEIQLTSVKRKVDSTPAGNSKRARRGEDALNTFTSTFFQPTENSKKDILLFFNELATQRGEKLKSEIEGKGRSNGTGLLKPFSNVEGMMWKKKDVLLTLGATFK
ncbi:unnamed protein product [Larinioides sclopetarius]|uniref:C2H2-type domain-containing protein n=1 Tax=Larinioides sclopetarius TaxID=280406 RepID=A0AAV2BW24_9ARAC